MDQQHLNADDLQAERRRLRRWSRCAKKSLEIVVYALNRYDLRLKSRGEESRRSPSDPMVLLISLAVVWVGERLACWPVGTCLTGHGHDDEDTHTHKWGRVAIVLRALCGGTQRAPLASKAEWPSVGGVFFGPQTLRLTELSEVFRDDEFERLEREISFSYGAPHDIVYELMLFYEGLLSYHCEPLAEDHLVLRGSSRHPDSMLGAHEGLMLSRGTYEEATTWLHRRTGRSISEIKRGFTVQHFSKLHDLAGQEPTSDWINAYKSIARRDMHKAPLVHPAGGLALRVGTSRKTSGAHFTPRVVAADLVSSALAQWFSARPDKRDQRAQHPFAQLKICDPAMGAGIFLLEACVQITQLIADEPLNRSTLIHVITHCLYGADLSPWSSELARISLWLLGGASPSVLTTLRCHLLTGDSLGVDTLTEEITIPSTDHHALYWQSSYVQPPRPIDWRDHIRLNQSGRGFDLVLGNPPYVSFYGRGSQAKRYRPEYLSALRRNHHRINGDLIIGRRLNLFLSFCALADHIISAGSLIALVLPESVLSHESYEPLRRALTRHGKLKSVTCYDDEVFVGATVGATVVTWGPRLIPHGSHRAERSEGAKETHTSSTLASVDARPKTQVLLQRRRRETTQEWRELHDDLLHRPLCSWYPTSTARLNQDLVRLSDSMPLGEIATLRDGFNTGSAQRRRSLLSASSEALTSPNPHRRPCLEGKWITPYHIKPRDLWITLPESISPERLSWYNQPKIIYRQTASHPIAAVDLDGLCYLNSAHAVTINAYADQAQSPENHTVLYALCAYLNSQRCERYYRALSGEQRPTFPQIHLSTMRRLLVPSCLFNAESEMTQKLALKAQALSGDGLTKSTREELLTSIEEQVCQLVDEPAHLDPHSKHGGPASSSSSATPHTSDADDESTYDADERDHQIR